ncbi:hypothetical protein CVT24_000007 [Panaeolus cyanescens]|uniref:F-box domain-containing protein n=1 Tax=Panaeolus cyanescens TaxID=181874 RepID=A0A409VS88_9AGAR|nr:hypothetical protein CVT24_000007 [Panaeolus cyanescens]
MSTSQAVTHGRGRAFPVEIFQKIIDAIPYDVSHKYITGWERQLLLKCALVCKDFLYFARPYLFWRVYVGSLANERERRDFRLAEVLKRNRYICSYLRDLSYDSSFRLSDAAEESEEELSIFLQLPNLQKLDVSCRIFPVNIPYSEMDPNLFNYRKILETYVPYGCLTTLTIFECSGLPLSLLLPSTTLKRLTLQRCEFSLDGLKLDGSQTPSFRLTHLILDSTREFPLSVLLNPRSCCELRYLNAHDLETPSNEPPVVWGTPADGVFTKLEKLIMDAQGGCGQLIEAASLGVGVSQMFPAVRTLTIRPWLSHFDGEDVIIYNNLFSRCSFPNLAEFYLEGSQFGADIFHLELSPCLEQCKDTLKKFSIRWDLGSVNITNPEFFIQAILPLLQNISASNVLEAIEFIIQIGFHSNWDAKRDKNVDQDQNDNVNQGEEDADGDNEEESDEGENDDREDEINDPDFEQWQAMEDLFLESSTRFPKLQSLKVFVQFKAIGDGTQKPERFITEYPQFDRFMTFAEMPLKKLRASQDSQVKCDFRVKLLAYVGSLGMARELRSDFRLAKVLTQNPYICSYLHDISYTSNFRLPNTPEESEEELSIFLRLPNLRKLDVSCRFFPVNIPFNELDPQTFNCRQILETYVPYGQLTDLTIFRFSGIPLSLLLPSTTLKRLTVKLCKFSLEGVKLDGSQTPSFRLTHLTLDATRSLPLSILLNPRSCSELRYLNVHDVDTPSNEPPVVWGTPADGVFTKLEKLIMDAQGASGKLIQAAALGVGVSQMFPAVRSLIIRPWHSRFNDENVTIYNNLFSQCSFPNLAEFHLEGSQNRANIYNLELSPCLEQCKDTLKNLSIRWDLESANITNPEFFIQATLPFLHNIPASNVLEAIEFTVQVGFHSNWDAKRNRDGDQDQNHNNNEDGEEGENDADEDEIHDPDFEQWQAMEDLFLESPLRFPKLRSLKVFVQFKHLDNDRQKLERFITEYPQFDRFMTFAEMPLKRLRAAQDSQVKCDFRVKLLVSVIAMFMKYPCSTTSLYAPYKASRFWGSFSPGKGRDCNQ